MFESSLFSLFGTQNLQKDSNKFAFGQLVHDGEIPKRIIGYYYVFNSYVY